MAEGARIAEAAGADIIDINMGCPARHVTDGQSGSALMRDLDHALTLIEATVAAVTVPVTLKMRLGWDDHSLNAPELARRAEAAGVQMITVHGRTRCQFYKGKRRLGARSARSRTRSAFRWSSTATSPSFDDAVAALESRAPMRVMIGRGAQGQPWLPGQIGRRLTTGIAEAAPSLREQLGYVRALYDEILQPLRPAHRRFVMPASISAGRSTSRRSAPRAGRDARSLAAEGADLGASRRACIARSATHSTTSPGARGMTSAAERRGRRRRRRGHPQCLAQSGAGGRARRQDRRCQHRRRDRSSRFRRSAAAPVAEGTRAVRQPVAVADRPGPQQAARRSTNTRSISARRGSAAIARSICMSRRSPSGPAISS